MLIKMKEDWPFEQWIWDAKLDGERVAWTDNVSYLLIDYK